MKYVFSISLLVFSFFVVGCSSSSSDQNELIDNQEEAATDILVAKEPDSDLEAET